MTEKMNILLAEDDLNLGNLLREYLNAKGFNTELVKNGKEGYDLFCKKEFDLCLLDVMMPVKDGFTLAREIREQNKDIPIVFLTAKSMKEDTIEGFKTGADDYLTKPFVMEELLLRINAILRRIKSYENTVEEKNEFEIGYYKFSYSLRCLIFNNKKQSLTTKEAELLKLLCTHNTLDRNFALNKIWGDNDYFKGRSMDVFIAKLRKYLKDDPAIELINIHGKGFKLTGVK